MAQRTGEARPGLLTLAATPIGRAEDAPPRLGRALGEADLVAAEDTRRLRRLAREMGADLDSARVVSYFEGNERVRAQALLEELRSGRDVLLLTDAGMPGVSDPGYRLVSLCADADIPVTVIAGPSAVTAALAVSGLPSDRFCFEGFPPRKGLARKLRELAEEPRTLVFFESPRRLRASLEAMAEAFGADRPAAVCRELTKTHEQVRRGTLAELADWARHDVKGEVTVVVGGRTGPREPPGPAALAAEVADAEAAGTGRKRAIAETARAWGLPKREVYDAVHRPTMP